MPIITITTDEKSIAVETQAAIIDVCEHEDTSILFGCRDGACGACLIKVLQNPENLSPMTEYERDFLETMAATPDERLACQCRVLGDVTIEISQ